MMSSTKLILAVVFVCSVLEINSSTEIEGMKSRVLSRKRRYLTFPDGASFSDEKAADILKLIYNANFVTATFNNESMDFAVPTACHQAAVCLTVGVLGQPALKTAPGTFVLAVNWGIAYELPNETQTVAGIREFKRIKTSAAMRRNRRELYGKMETIMDNMGYNGRDCILKTLCETTQRIAPRTRNMMETIFRTLFTLPATKVSASEPREHHIYDTAHRYGASNNDCDLFHCPLSLVDLIKGYYNMPSPNYDIAQNPLSWFSKPFG